MPFFRRKSGEQYVAGVAKQDKPLPRSEFHGDVAGDTWELPRGTVIFQDAKVHGLRARGRVIDNFAAFGSEFTECDFVHSRFEAGVLGHVPQVVYWRCDFEGADLRRVNPMYARFEDCDFSAARIDDWPADCAEFVGCRFTGRIVRAKFSARPRTACREKLTGARAERNEFRNNDFSDAELVDCAFRGGIRIEANGWPSADDYLFLGSLQDRIRHARPVIEAWPPNQARTQALAFLDVFSSRGYAQQDDLIARRSDLGPVADVLASVDVG